MNTNTNKNNNNRVNTVMTLLCVFGVVFWVWLIGSSIHDVSASKCSKSGCSNYKTSGSSYCYIHTPKKRTSTSSGKSASSKTYSGSSKNYSTTSSGSSYKSSGNSYKSSYDMPDVDDYDSFDDFMDDWDGNMPDGSDAWDYYDNW